jgi:outer membrane protein OmpA-like peptidoglycan-associated protein
MWSSRYARLSRIVLAASGIALAIHGQTLAQTIQVFDDAPSIEQLRAIMVPESLPGAGRSIVMHRLDTSTATAPVQKASVQVAAAEPAPAPTPAKPANRPKTGTVGFRINFAFNSAALPDSAHGMMDTVAQLMKESPDIKVRIEGHTDATGSAAYNVSLSERRALSVGEYLAKQGVDPSRMVLIGKGMADPLTANPYDGENRRVQFVRNG